MVRFKGVFKKLFWLTLTGGACGFAASLYLRQPHTTGTAAASLPQPTLASLNPVSAFRSIQAKVDELQQADQENARLRVENAHLRLKLEANQYECDARLSSTQTRTIGHDLKSETGSVIGRTLASINYQMPEHLLPEQLYTLGATYFSGREDEKAAAILTFLTRMEGTTYQTPQIELMTAVAWYRLEHYELSRIYLQKVLEARDDKSVLPVQAQARLWMALVNERVGRHKDSQSWLKELIDYHPQSTEASWVNTYADPREVGRVPANHEE